MPVAIMAMTIPGVSKVGAMEKNGTTVPQKKAWELQANPVPQPVKTGGLPTVSATLKKVHGTTVD